MKAVTKMSKRKFTKQITIIQLNDNNNNNIIHYYNSVCLTDLFHSIANTKLGN